MLEAQEESALAQGLSVIEKIRGTYPKFPERAEGYLQYYSERLDMRLFILKQDKKVTLDSFKQVPENAVLSLDILDHSPAIASSQFILSPSYGHVQYTLLKLDSRSASAGYLLMIKNINPLYDNIRYFRRQVMTLMLIVVTVVFFICYFVSSWFTLPIRHIMNQLEEISPQKRTFHVKYKKKDEIRGLIQAIETMVQQLNLYEQQQRQFLSTASHELKTPLATMSLICENLPIVRENESLHVEFVTDLSLQIDKMKKMVENLLNVNRISDRPLQRIILSSDEIEQHIRHQFQHIADHKQLRFDFLMDPFVLYVDRDIFLRGIDNLVSNAIRYSPPNKSITIVLKRIYNNQSIEFSICDQGIGISKKELPFIFEPFYRSREATEWNQEGSGLGLTIVKQMVEMHGGEMKVETTVGQGTCMIMRFPENKVL